MLGAGGTDITISGFMNCGKLVTLTASSSAAIARAMQDLRC
jgi:hypothetical protein